MVKGTLLSVGLSASILSLGVSPIDAATIVDQTQTNYGGLADISQSGKTGQTFTAGITGQLLGLRLVVEGAHYTNDPDFGSAAIITLRRVIDGAITSDVLATGNLSLSSIEKDVAKWITIDFLTPYFQTAGETLAFTILETAGGGADGWNNYGQTSSMGPDLYAGGQYFTTYTEGVPLTSTPRDFAFETIIPEPTTIVLLLGSGLFWTGGRRFRRG